MNMYKSKTLVVLLSFLLCAHRFLLIHADPTAEPSTSSIPSTSPFASPSERPSAHPSRRPTAHPSKYPSLSPIISQSGMSTMVTKRITITMDSVNPLDVGGRNWFQDKLSEYIQTYFQSEESLSFVESVQVNVKITEMDPPFGASVSNGGTLRITYDQTTIYRVLDEDRLNLITPKLFVVDPLNSLRKREEFVTFIASDDGSGVSNLFSNLNEITQPVLYTSPETSSTIIIAASVGGSVFLLLVGVIFYYRKRKRDKFYNQDAADYNPKNMTPGHVQLPV